MTWELAHSGHVQWGSLDMFSFTENVAQISIVTSPLLPDLEYTAVIKLTGNASRGGIRYEHFKGVASYSNVSQVGTTQIWHGYLRWTSLAPASEYAFLHFGSNPALSLALKTDGNISVIDQAGTSIATITGALTVDTWHRFVVRYKQGNTGEVQVWIDGTEVVSNLTGLDFDNSMGWSWVKGPPAASGDLFYAGSVVFHNSTTADDRIDGDFEFLGPYQATAKNTAAADTGPGNTPGTDLTGSVWSDAMDNPQSSSNPASYDDNPSAGGVYLEGGTRAGPSGDSRIDGDANILGMQVMFWADRTGGGATNHTFIAGNKTDDYDSAFRFLTPDQSTIKMRHIITSGDQVPTSNQFGMIGFEVDGAQNMDLFSVAMWILHEPTPPVPLEIEGSFSGLILAGWF